MLAQLVTLAAAGWLSTFVPSSPATACAATPPNLDTPPPAVRARAGVPLDDALRHGNGSIWTSLWPNGTIVFKTDGPGVVLPDGTMKMKFLWILAGDGPLTLGGRRLDAAAPPMSAILAPGFEGRGFQPSYLVFPSEGCWEITATANGSTLTFVTAVTRS